MLVNWTSMMSEGGLASHVTRVSVVLPSAEASTGAIGFTLRSDKCAERS